MKQFNEELYNHLKQNPIKEVFCDSCSKEFKIEDIKKKFLDYKNKRVEIQYFQCPHCEKEYITQCLTTDIKTGIKKREKLVKKLHKVKTEAERQKLWQQIEELKNRLMEEQNEMKKYFTAS